VEHIIILSRLFEDLSSRGSQEGIGLPIALRTTAQTLPGSLR
jgi:hypothetical protein